MILWKERAGFGGKTIENGWSILFGRLRALLIFSHFFIPSIDEVLEYRWGPEPTTKKEFLRRLWCKMVVLLKHGDNTSGQEELLPLACEGWLIIYLRVGRGLRIAVLSKEFWKQGFQDVEGASYCWEKVIYYRLIKPESWDPSDVYRWAVCFGGWLPTRILGV